MAVASIESTVTAPVAKATVTGASRDDLEINDVVLLNSAHVGTGYAWSLAYAPEGSAAAFSGSAVAQSPGSFTVDVEGPYLIRLQFTDGTGVTEQFVRLRALTVLGSLKLISAGERVDTVSVPVDITTAGWADEQNFNLLTLLGFIQTAGVSGRLLYVDAAQGDYQTIQAAINYAVTQTPTAVAPWIILVRPGTYVEDLTFAPFVHVFGWPGGQTTEVVRIRNATASHTAVLAGGADDLALANLFFEFLVASATPLLDVSGAGTLSANKCVFSSEGAGAPQGPGLLISASAGLLATDCRFLSTAASSTPSFALEVGTTASATIRNSSIQVRGLKIGVGSSVQFIDGSIIGTGDYGVWSDGTLFRFEYSQVSGGLIADIALNPPGAAVVGDLKTQIRWSQVGNLVFDIAGVTGATELLLGSSEHGTLTFPSGSPATLAATTLSSTIFFDNVASGLTAENVQDALDEIFTFASAVRTLDEAYDAGAAAGAGRTIIADQGAVRITDAAVPSDPIPPGNTNGNLEVVGSIHIGAINNPEGTFDPNPFGNGPLILLGRVIQAGDAPFGSTATIFADSTGAPSFNNYNLRIGTKTAVGAGAGIVGHVIVRGGDSLLNPTTGSTVFIQAGRGVDGAGGDGGSVFIAPGDSVAGTGGSTFFIRPEDGTPATLTAAGAFVGGVTGLIRFATDQGAIEISIDAADNLAATLVKLNAPGFVLATDSGGGVIRLTTVSNGPTAEVFFLNAGAGLDVALGVWAGQVMVAGTWPSFMEVVVTAANEIAFGPAGAAGPLIYNATTGKLTVPGIIDPTGIVFDNNPPLSSAATKGAIWVGDGTGGTVLGDFYYRYEAGAIVNISAATGVVTGVTQDEFLSAAFAFGGGVSSVATSVAYDTAAALVGMVLCFENGVADMTNVGPAGPVTAKEYRINGANLEIGADITLAGNVYRLVYPS